LPKNLAIKKVAIKQSKINLPKIDGPKTLTGWNGQQCQRARILRYFEGFWQDKGFPARKPVPEPESSHLGKFSG
jgi:hypothetical protein